MEVCPSRHLRLDTRRRTFAASLRQIDAGREKATEKQREDEVSPGSLRTNHRSDTMEPRDDA